MDFNRVITHMNEHHQQEMKALCLKFGKVSQVDCVELVNVDFEGIDLTYNEGNTLRINFLEKANVGTLKQAIISLCLEVLSGNLARVQERIIAFRQGVKSCVLATLDKTGFPFASYAPIIELEGKHYIYISSVAEHYANILQHPDKIDVMFLEDEHLAKSIIVRTRLRYRARAQFISREDPIFERALAKLAEMMGNSGGIKTIREFVDFSLIELTFGRGRFVRGFGQAYNIDEQGNVMHLGGDNPHQKSAV